MQNENQFKLQEELKQSWYAYSDNWFALCLIYFLRGWLTLISACMTFALLINFKGWSLVAAILTAIFTASFLQIPYLKFFKPISQGKKADWSVLKINLKLGLNMLLTQLFVMLSVAAGLILLIVPGIILGVRLLPSAYLVTDGKSPLESINTSFKITGGFVIPLTVIFVLFGILDYFSGFLALISEFVLTIFVYRFSLSRMEERQE